MLNRTVAIPVLLAASVAVPYVATNAPQWKQKWGATANSGQPAPPEALGSQAVLPKPLEKTLPAPQGPGAALYPRTAPLEGTPTYSLEEVLRLDVTKEWVYQRWARKSTALAELDLFGVRVPLVTGTAVHDLAGSLTYFFGADGRVQRISFRGRTGDTTRLVTLVTQRYGLSAQHTAVAGEQLFQLRQGNDVLSELRTEPAPVLWSSSPHDSFSVAMELQNPATARPLKPEMIATAPKPVPPAPVANTQAEAAKGTAADASTAKEQAKRPFDAFFPRSRVPAGQIKNLDNRGLAQ